jgi:hypothetical protein
MAWRRTFRRGCQRKPTSRRRERRPRTKTCSVSTSMPRRFRAFVVRCSRGLHHQPSERLRPFREDLEILRIGKHPLPLAAGDLPDDAQHHQALDSTGNRRHARPGAGGQGGDRGQRPGSKGIEHPLRAGDRTAVPGDPGGINAKQGAAGGVRTPGPAPGRLRRSGNDPSFRGA